MDDKTGLTKPEAGNNEYEVVHSKSSVFYGLY